MSVAQAYTPPSDRSSQPLAWPVAGGRTQFGFSVRGDEDVQALHRIGTKIRVPRGKTIFNQGDDAEHAYKIISGTVRLIRHLTDGRRQVAHFLFPGDLFSFMQVPQYSFTAEAVGDAVLLSFPKRAVQQLMLERASVQERFLTLLQQSMLDAQNHLMMLGRQTAKERVASFLIFVWERIGDEDDELLDVPMSRLDIADFLGLTIETVCRVLTEMKREGVVAIPNARQLVLRDIDTLHALADGVESDS